MGGGVHRVVGRAAGAAGLGGAQEVFSAARPRPASLLSVPVPSSSSVSMPVSATSNSPLYCTEADGWQAVDKDHGVTVFGPAPSKGEAEDALSALQQIFAPVSHSKITEGRLPYSSQIRDLLGQTQMANTSELTPQNSSAEQRSDWTEVAGHVYATNEAPSQGFNNVLDSFRLLQSNPSVQRMVVSLSSDKAVWDAVMNNEAVQELRESLYAGKHGSLPNSSGGNPSDAANRVSWILETVRAMMMELIDRIAALVDHLFRPPHNENQNQGQNPIHVFNDTVRSSFMLSIMVLLVVVMSRIQNP